MKILIVEDDFVIAESLASELKNGITVLLSLNNLMIYCLSLTNINLSLYC